MPKDADFGPSPLGSFAKCVRASLPRLNYASLFLGTVVAQNQVAGTSQVTLDVVVDDPSIPSMQGVPLMNGLPGVVLKKLLVGAAVLVGWSESDPARPFCCTFGGGEHVGAMTLNADQLTLGGDVGAEAAIKGVSYRSAEDAMLSTFSGLMTTATGLCHAATNPATTMAAVQGIAVMLDGMISAITSFQGGAVGYLATNVKVK